LSPPNQPSETARHLRLQGVPLTAVEFSGIFSFLVSSSTSDSHSDAVELSMTAPTPLGGSPRRRPSPDHQGSSPYPSNHPIFSSKDCGLPLFPPLSQLNKLCCPQPIVRGSSSFGLLYPMFRFPGCVFMRRQLQLIKCEEYLTNLDTREPSVNAFNVENLQCKVSQPAAVRLLFTQNFNDAKVVAPPYRPSFHSGFCRLLHYLQETLQSLTLGSHDLISSNQNRLVKERSQLMQDNSKHVQMAMRFRLISEQYLVSSEVHL